MGCFSGPAVALHEEHPSGRLPRVSLSYTPATLSSYLLLQLQGQNRQGYREGLTLASALFLSPIIPPWSSSPNLSETLST